MKKILILFICTVFLFSFSSCDNSDKKTDGFTPTELAEYLSSVDGITNTGANNNKLIICENNYKISASTRDRMNIYKFNMKDYLHLFIPDENPLSGAPSLSYTSTNLFENEGLAQAYFFDKLKEAKSNYYGASPNNFAYIIRDCGFNSSPEWTEWVDYDIPINHEYKLNHGEWNQYWYNPITEEFEIGHYYRDLENSTEIYLVYQNMSLFYYSAGHLPVLMSEELYEHLKETYKNFHFENYQKGTVKEFSEWFMGEYLENVPTIFSDIKAEYVYYPAYGSGIRMDFDGYEEEGYDAVVKWFISDMKNLGVNFDELRSYIIKATVPHDGTIQDIFWELIG
ncbi:MAG: hypothetical protein E7477_04600 [Ruminococcaceae bacterium]|nr:hypothetical protein [Oscillospiraceae bacterium]